jgi:hypothetical protein
MGRVPEVRRPGHPLGEAPDGEDPAPAGHLFEERERALHLGRRGAPVRALGAGMRRHDVPAERLELELGQDGLDDRRRRLRRAAAGQLPLGPERDAGDSRTAEPGRFADEEDAVAAVLVQVARQALAAEGRTLALAVEVVRRADPRSSQALHELVGAHVVTMLMPVRGRVGVGALAALCIGVAAPSASAAPPPQGYQSDAAFARSYTARGVSSVAATAQRVSCYAPEVVVLLGLAPEQGFPQGGGTPCPGATTGENIGPYPTQDVKSPALLVKDYSESDIRVDPTNPRHVIGISKWFVNAEGYNHLTGFFESFDGGASWPQQGHVPGYEGWTDNSDPVGAFDPWGNYYAVVLPYMFDYDAAGRHNLSARVNPALPRSGIGIAVRPHGATTADAWFTSRGNHADFVATEPLGGLDVFDKQWITIDRGAKSKHRGRVYVMWAVGGDDSNLRIFESHADARPNGTHSDWSTPKLALRRAAGLADNGALPQVTPDGTVWLEASASGDPNRSFIATFTSSRDGGATWGPRRGIVRHLPSSYDSTTFRSAFGEAFAVGPRKVGKFYPLYLAYEDAPNGPVEIRLTASFDGGRHWRRSIRVNDSRGSGESLQPALTVAPNGVVAVAFYDRRLACPGRGSAEAGGAGLQFDPEAPYGRVNWCINTAVQLYRAGLRPIGRNVRVSPHTWDPELSAPRFACICVPASFIGDYFGADARGGFVFTASVTTYNEAGQNQFFHQQQLVSKLKLP